MIRFIDKHTWLTVISLSIITTILMRLIYG